jgi:preprotein translocase subunit SecF
MQIFNNPNYKFVKYRWHGVAISLVFVIAGIVAYFVNHVNWGIDFAGGASVILKFKDTPPLTDLRRDLSDATIQQYGKPEDRALLIRLPKLGTETDYAGQVVGNLNKKLNPESATVSRRCSSRTIRTIAARSRPRWSITTSSPAASSRSGRRPESSLA